MGSVKLQTAGSEDRPSTMQPGVTWVITVAACVTGSVRAQDVCGRGEDCVSTRSCPTIVQQLTIARSTNDPVEKRELVTSTTFSMTLEERLLLWTPRLS